MNYKTRNPHYRAIALANGPFDTKHWPIPPYSGQTGGDFGYGWNFEHLVNQTYVNNVIQCYASRPGFYENALVRELGYNKGSRPFGWIPLDDGNLEGDMPNGIWTAPDGTQISGPDVLHIPLAPLVAIAQSKGFTVQTPDGVVSAETFAKELLVFLSMAHVGMIRKQVGTKITISPYIGPDRQQHYIFRTLVDGVKLGFLTPYDMQTLVLYIVNTVLPAWEAIPYGSDLRVYNGLHWVLPAIYDAWVLAPEGPAKDLTTDILKAKAKCCLQLAQLVPGNACTVTEIETGWGPNLKDSDIVLSSYMGPWGIRAMLCSAKILGGDDGALCEQEAMNEFAKWNGKPEGDNLTSWKCWSVDADGNYLW